MSSIVEENIKGHCEKQSDEAIQNIKVLRQAQEAKKDGGAVSLPNGWHEVKLGKICKFFSGGTPSRQVEEYFTGDIPFIGSGDIKKSSVEQFITEDALKNSSAKMVEKGDLLYALYGATSGETAICEINGAINQAVLCIRTEENKFYLYNYFLLKKQSILNSYLQGGQGNLSAEIIKSLKIKIPKQLKEQEAIAGILSGADEVIELCFDKLSKLKKRKKSLMQKLLAPKPHWVEKRLGNLCTVKHGKPQHNVEDKNGIYPILATGGIIGHTNHFLCDTPSVLIGRKGTIDKPQYMQTPFWTVDTLFYTNNFSQVLPKWLYYKFLTINWYKYNEGSTVPSLTASGISSIKVFIPPTTKEQEQIASVLSSCDEEIELWFDKLTKLEQQKKGLMQKLLTGKWRVSIPSTSSGNLSSVGEPAEPKGGNND